MSRGILVHEWLAEHGGSENVFDVLVDTFPDADLLCLWSDVPNRYPARHLRETWLARTPLRQHKALALPLMPLTWRNRRPGGYDWALISSHLFAHHVAFAGQSPDFRKIVYVHSPARYLWNPDLDARGSSPLIRAVAAPLKGIDRKRASEATHVIANSKFVAERVKRAWGRDASVIYPPVATEAIRDQLANPTEYSENEALFLNGLPEVFVLGASRFVSYKRLDLVILAAEAAGIPAVIAGAGPDYASLRSLAHESSQSVTFAIAPSNRLLRELYRRALVFAFPPVEDFGIMPVEALAAGTPIAVGPQGGAREIVDGYPVGTVATSATARGLADAIHVASRFDRDACIERAAQFSTNCFAATISRIVDNFVH